MESDAVRHSSAPSPYVELSPSLGQPLLENLSLSDVPAELLSL